jgi:carboxyl-terminal processing protease
METESGTALDKSPTQGGGETPSMRNQGYGSRLAMGCLVVALGLVVFGAGGAIGFGFGRLSSDGTSRGTQAADGLEDPRAALQSNFDVFWEAMDVLYGNFYGQLPEGESATHNAIRGIVNELDDPNTSYLTPDEADVFRENITGEFEGIGARVEWDEEADTVRVVEPFENQPAWKAGIKRGDLILAVNGESLVGTDLSSGVSKIRGPKGSTALLRILRLEDGDGEPFEVEVVRDRIETPTVTTDSMGENDDIAYVRLYTFNENAGTLVRQAVDDAVKRDAKGLILDLRGNTGGLLREAVKVSSVFLEGDEVVLYERFRDGKEEIYRTSDDAVAAELPLVVLVNEGSASASEIVAGALQDTERATLIGTTTYGKGSVQLPETLSDESIMRVTIAKWFTPKNRTIDGTGLMPEVVVEMSDEQRAAGDDPQLERALNEVSAMMSAQVAP